MSKPFFSESDCDYNGYLQINNGETKYLSSAISLEKANRLIQERAKVVTGMIEKECSSVEFGSGQFTHNDATHQALLICVEEIEKERPTEVVSNFGISVFGLNEEQIKHCKDFYESRTGERAEDIGKEDSAEQLLKDWLECANTYAAQVREGPFKTFVDRAKRLLEGK